MKRNAIVVIIGIALLQLLTAQTVWKSTNGTVTFTKAAFADWKLAANQDRISDSVWITRSNTQSIFNIRKDTSYASNAPSGTLWALGTTDSFATLSYKSFVTLSGGSPQGLIGKNLVLHLVAENIYLDLKFVTYAGGNTGGGFSYTRASKPGPTLVHAVGNAPKQFALEQNYPNPFNPSTTFSFTLQNTGLTTLRIYNVVGQEVATLINGVREAGVHHQVVFDARHLSSGVYFARLTSGTMVQVRKLMLTK
ncbi:MAG: T9SS type A sorting domain-containing protein [Bacteroidetes bacterium]|nr:T9SS type A sorting domain-containing protein [Bacteroidota bacterium]